VLTIKQLQLMLYSRMLARRLPDAMVKIYHFHGVGMTCVWF
jgi:hypothetical protein